MTERKANVIAQDGLTVGHLKKSFTTAHLQQALGTNPATGGASGSGSGGPSGGATTSPSSTTTQGTGSKSTK